MATSVANQLVEEYSEKLPEYRLLHDRILSVLKSAVLVGQPVLNVRSRIKDWSSVSEKIQAKGHTDLSSISDIIGIRVVVPTAADVTALAEEIARQKYWQIGDITETTSSDEDFEGRHINLQVNPQLFGAFRLQHAVVEISIVTPAVEALVEALHSASYKDGEPQPLGAPAVAGALSVTLLERAIDEFETLLRRPDVYEKRDIHPFIEEHSFLLHPNPIEIISEVSIGLGTEYRIDFLVREPDGSYVLVELENVSHNLFTKAGDFSAAVNHGIRQIEDWQDWIEDNLPIVQKKYPGIVSPMGMLVLGRRGGLSNEERRRLSRRNINTRGRLVIRTYDDLIESGRRFVESIRRHVT